MKMKFLYTLFFAAVLLSSCEKNYLDVNEVNPNQTQNPPINGLLAQVTYQTGLNHYRAGDFTSYYMQYLASPNASGGSDTYDNVDRSSLWYNVYNTMKDERIMREKAEANNAYEHVGVAKVTEAMNMSLLIGLFGDVPYSEAFDPTNFSPAYDDGQQIYNSLLTLLDEAVADFSKADPTIKLDAASDMIHNGNTQNWIKTAYAIKARLLNRLSKTQGYNTTAILDALSKSYTSNADDAQLTRFVARSPWNQAAYNNTVNLLDAWLSEQFVDHLDGTTYGVVDPRLQYIATKTKFGDYRGTPNGKGRIGTGTDDEESYLSLDGFYSKSGAPLLLVPYAEMKFIEAEATFATDKARSYQAYLDGIKAHMDKMGVPAAEQTAYLNDPAVAVGVAGFTKALIFKEKYVAMFLQPEAWVDARRFDYMYKDFEMPFNAILPTFIRRVGYPATETDRNGESVPAVSSLADKLWWDQ
jgi:hypothetical protein